MASVERIVLPPASSSRLQTRFSLPQSGELEASSLHLEVQIAAPAADSAWWIPRIGGFGLIAQLELLRNGETVSYLNRADTWAAIKALCVDAEHADSLEGACKGAVKVDVAEVGSPQAAVNGIGFDTHLVQFSKAARGLDVIGAGTPLLPLAHIMDIFAKNALIDLRAARYELVVTWQSTGGVQPAASIAGGTQAVTTLVESARLFYNLLVRDVVKPREITPWLETRFTSAVLPALAANTADAQTIPLRFSACPASAIILAFVDNSTAPVDYSSSQNTYGQARSVRCSTGAFSLQLLVNNEAILPRPLSQDSERLFELGLALDQVSGLGTGGLACPLNTGGRTWTQYQRSHMLISPGDQVGTTCFYGFRLTKDGAPIVLNDLGIYMQLNRAGAAGGTPQLSVYAFLLSPSSV